MLLAATPAFAPSCELQIGVPLYMSATLTSLAGDALRPLPVTNDPSLLGIELYCQWAVFDSGGQFIGALSLSEGMRLRPGR
jgi:hypothetical protein